MAHIVLTVACGGYRNDNAEDCTTALAGGEQTSLSMVSHFRNDPDAEALVTIAGPADVVSPAVPAVAEALVTIAGPADVVSPAVPAVAEALVTIAGPADVVSPAVPAVAEALVTIAGPADVVSPAVPVAEALVTIAGPADVVSPAVPVAEALVTIAGPADVVSPAVPAVAEVQAMMEAELLTEEFGELAECGRDLWWLTENGSSPATLEDLAQLSRRIMALEAAQAAQAATQAAGHAAQAAGLAAVRVDVRAAQAALATQAAVQAAQGAALAALQLNAQCRAEPSDLEVRRALGRSPLRGADLEARVLADPGVGTLTKRLFRGGLRPELALAALQRPPCPPVGAHKQWTAEEVELLQLLVQLGVDDPNIAAWLAVGHHKKVLRKRAEEGAPATPIRTPKADKRRAAATPASSAKKARR
eukprot:EG_transcript_12774